MDKKISELTGATSVSVADVFPIVQGSNTNKVSVQTLFTNPKIFGVPIPQDTPETITSGVISVAKTNTILNPSGANAFSLAVPATPNIDKFMVMTGTGTATVTVESGIGFTTISFVAVGQSALLRLISGSWAVIGLHGATLS